MIFNNQKYLFFLLIAALNLKAQEITDSKYNIKDLEILEKEKNYPEFFLHAYDLKPSERTKHWKKIYQNMAVILVDSKIILKDFSKKTFQEIEALARNTQLIDDEVFQNRRNSYAEKYFKECFFNNVDKSTCEQELSIHWENSNKDPDAALSYTNWLASFESKMDTWTFYNAIVNDQIAPLYCKKPEIQRAVIKKLSLEAFKENFEGSYKTIIGKYISDKCIKELYPTFKEAIISPKTNGLDKEQAITILWQMNQITDEEKEFYLVSFLFSGPVVGEKMNLAWKFVESLSENYPKRIKILEKMKALDLIPANIFNDPNLPRNKAIITLFAKNFPELLNYYGRECLDFLKGKDGTHVTSGYNCNQFLSYSSKIHSDDKVEWTTDIIKTEYSSLKK